MIQFQRNVSLLHQTNDGIDFGSVVVHVPDAKYNAFSIAREEIEKLFNIELFDQLAVGNGHP